MIASRSLLAAFLSIVFFCMVAIIIGYMVDTVDMEDIGEDLLIALFYGVIPLTFVIFIFLLIINDKLLSQAKKKKSRQKLRLLNYVVIMSIAILIVAGFVAFDYSQIDRYLTRPTFWDISKEYLSLIPLGAITAFVNSWIVWKHFKNELPKQVNGK